MCICMFFLRTQIVALTVQSFLSLLSNGGFKTSWFGGKWRCQVSYPYAPCMEYLPTFTLKIDPNVGKYSIHGASGIGIRSWTRTGLGMGTYSYHLRGLNIHQSQLFCDVKTREKCGVSRELEAAIFVVNQQAAWTQKTSAVSGWCDWRFS